MYQSGGHARGFTLVEALVALVVISVGMIGIAALHGQGLGAGRTALHRTLAVNLVSDMAERIRLNRLGRQAYENPVNNQCDPLSGGRQSCTPSLLAEHERFGWDALVGTTLPNGVGAVEFVDGTPPSYTIEVRWDEAGLGVIHHQVTVRVAPL